MMKATQAYLFKLAVGSEDSRHPGSAKMSCPRSTLQREAESLYPGMLCRNPHHRIGIKNVN